MKIAIGSDHRGVGYKALVKGILAEAGHTVSDFGTDSEESCDYPDLALPVAESVAAGANEKGILICSSGIGMSIAANKVKGVRAAVCVDEKMAELSRRHNNSNVLCLGQDLVDEETCLRIVERWLATDFEGGRHDRRLGKIKSFECRS